MRIVIDMQGAQTESRFRGIGRYTISFAQAVVRNRGQHEIFLALSGLFPETIESLREAFDGLLPQENIRVWSAPDQVCEQHQANEDRRHVAELIREAFLASLKPDVIHISSLFEGYIDNAVVSIGRYDIRTPVSVALYDLIPLLNPSQYLKNNPSYEKYYLRKLGFLQQANLLLAISEFTRQEGIAHLDIAEFNVVNVSTAIEPNFQPLNITEKNAHQLRSQFGITRPFVLYTGGTDERKNLRRLIEAYAALPLALRRKYQLIFAGKMSKDAILQFKHVAQKAGMEPEEIAFTGYVTDEVLVQLYNLCTLYVFPSWHEGFGLPALEAMACGAPVLGANTSSLPEVIGLDEALFDPKNNREISAIIQHVLEDESFQDRLRAHGLQRAQLFSWDQSAKRAIAAWESLPVLQPLQYGQASLAENRLYEALAKNIYQYNERDLATIAHCMAHNQQAGIERQLLVDVSELCRHDAATGVQRVVRSYLKWLLELPPSGFRVEPVYASHEHGYRYARRFTQRFVTGEESDFPDEPIRWQRGDMFFGLDMQHHVQIAHRAFYQQLRQEGVTVKFMVYDLLPIQLENFFRDSNASQLHVELLKIIAETDGAICISKATSDALVEWIDVNAIPHANSFQSTWVHIGADIEGSFPSRGVPTDAKDVLAVMREKPTFLCVSTLEPRKAQQQILEATELLWERGDDVNLVFVGQDGWKVEELANRIRQHHELGRRLFWLQGISDEYLDLTYKASSCLVAASINEGFGLPLIEAARHGIPIIARDIPVFREVAGDGAFYFKGVAALDLANAMEDWLTAYDNGTPPKPDHISWSSWQQSTENLKKLLIAQHACCKQLLVDISELVQRDVKSGIQRVVRSLITEWLGKPHSEYKIEPVYATHTGGYLYARKFRCRLMSEDDAQVVDDPIDFAPGDIFLGLDLAPVAVPAQTHFFTELRRAGVKVGFIVYDLLPLNEGYYPKEHADAYVRWLDEATNANMVVCISEAVASELKGWLSWHKPERLGSIQIESFHLGADIDSSVPTDGLPKGAQKIIELISAKPSFLVVSTLAPHKGHAQVLDAFDQLWQNNADLNLVIVGKEGWRVEGLVARLRSHPEFKKHLFWLEGISDEYLEKIYAASTCLISASYAEGFGLPLIEAAQYKLPIIARDIPVSREVAGEHAYYFEGVEPSDLASAIEAWLILYEQKKHPKSEEMPWLTWKESAAVLLQKLGNLTRQS
jgi:glycosyltransferase involved in cell wall biosynthesis